LVIIAVYELITVTLKLCVVSQAAVRRLSGPRLTTDESPLPLLPADDAAWPGMAAAILACTAAVLDTRSAPLAPVVVLPPVLEAFVVVVAAGTTT
jgi:hypothetical protein